MVVKEEEEGLPGLLSGGMTFISFRKGTATDLVSSTVMFCKSKLEGIAICKNMSVIGDSIFDRGICLSYCYHDIIRFP